MMIVQFLAVGLAISVSLKTIFDFRKRKISFKFFLFWMLIWILILIVAFLPQITLPLSNFLGVGRGIDVAVYFSIVLIFFILLEIVKKLTKIEKEITNIVRDIAIHDLFKNNP